jgi:hypothetical protein
MKVRVCIHGNQTADRLLGPHTLTEYYSVDQLILHFNGKQSIENQNAEYTTT